MSPLAFIGLGAGPTPPEPDFAPGDLVSHRRYGYRGVVVAFDRHCQADEVWYQSNQSQPKRDQPWYHVLVHGSAATTYAAQTSLQADPSGAPIIHPLMPMFFDELADGRYQRNDEPWPGA